MLVATVRFIGRVRVLLRPGQERPPLLKNKSIVEGTYADELGARLKAEGLWDSDVVATIEVEYDVRGTTPTPRPSTYVLLHAEPLIPRDRFPSSTRDERLRRARRRRVCSGS